MNNTFSLLVWLGHSLGIQCIGFNIFPKCPTLLEVEFKFFVLFLQVFGLIILDMKGDVFSLRNRKWLWEKHGELWALNGRFSQRANAPVHSTKEAQLHNHLPIKVKEATSESWHLLILWTHYSTNVLFCQVVYEEKHFAPELSWISSLGSAEDSRDGGEVLAGRQRTLVEWKSNSISCP